jgi:hypothetical protein
MKRAITIALALALCIAFTRSVNAYCIPRFGIIVGLSWAYLKNLNGTRTSKQIFRNSIESESPQYEERKGIPFSIFYNFYLNKKRTLAIEVDVLYSQKGASEKISESELRINYIEIPVLFKFKIPDLPLNLFIGPYLAFKLDAEVINGDDFAGINPSDVKLLDAGITFGGSFQFKVVEVTDRKDIVLIIGARYSKGLAKIVDQRETQNSTFAIFTGLGLVTTPINEE